MYRSVTDRIARWRATRSSYIFLALAFAAYVSAGWMAWLQWTEGPPTQRVNIRWAPDVSSVQRTQAERELGLADGDRFEDRTWRYFLRKRSREDIERILTDPRVED